MSYDSSLALWEEDCTSAGGGVPRGGGRLHNGRVHDAIGLDKVIWNISKFYFRKCSTATTTF